MHQRQLLLLKVTCCTVLFLLLPVLGWSPTAFASEKSPMAPNIIPVGNNTADGAPSLWNFGGTLYLAWTGTDNAHHLYIVQAYTSVGGGLSFQNQRQINDTTIPGNGPTLASYQGELYLAWLSSAGDRHIYLGWYNGSSTLVNHATFDANACSRPAMVSLNDTLYIAWRECGTNVLDIASGDGSNFNIQRTGETTLAGPAMQIFNGHIYITWMGTNSGHNIYLGTYPGFGFKINYESGGRLTDSTTEDMGMAPNTTPGISELELGWRGSTNTNLYIGSYQNSSQLGTIPLNIPSLFGPGMSTSYGHFYVAWADPAAFQLNIAAVL